MRLTDSGLKPEEKFDLDDYAEFASLQHELKSLKDNSQR
jgi:hypothetical protein